MFKRYKKTRSHFHRSIYYLITGLGIVVFWRGIWGLLDIYLLPNNPEWSYLISTVAGLFILFLNDYSFDDIS